MRSFVFCVLLSVFTDIVLANNSICDKCSKQEVCQIDVPGCLPERTCQNPNPQPTSSACTEECITRCECNIEEDYIRDNTTKKCVKINQCPVQCEDDEELEECASICLPERSCQNPNPQVISTYCSDQCFPRCECCKGLIRDASTGKCVEEGKCPAGKCTKNNEVLTECASACLPERTCENPNPKPTSDVCTLQCIQRCDCSKGFIRDSSGNCIPEDKCPAKCTKKDEVWVDCASICIPERTCQNPNPKPISDICPKICIARCECNKGFIRDSSGNCIPEDECPVSAKCTKNDEVLVECASACLGERTCENPNPKPTSDVCTLQCIQRCECSKGFIRDSSGNCIPEDSCPVSAKCTKNDEVLVECASACLGERTCENPNPKPTSDVCTLQCIQRCECSKGFIRDSSGNCIPEDNCPVSAKCTKHDEVLVECASACLPERTCENPNPKPTSDVCTLQCVQRCECNKGFIRDSSGNCIPENECPGKCGKDEIYNECASPCLAERNCFYRYPNSTSIPCVKRCEPRCECNAELGFIRDPTTGGCVLRCSETCGPNQYLGCRPGYGEPTCHDPTPCETECLCKPGCFRNTNKGTCVDSTTECSKQ